MNSTNVKGAAIERVDFFQRYRKAINRLLLYGILLIVLILFVSPLYWMVAVSLKTPPGVHLYPVEIWPKDPVWDNYLEVWRRAKVGRYILNSVILSSLFTSLVVLSSSFCGYGFARFNVRFKNILFIIVISTMMMPPIVTLIPQFMLFHRLRMLNSYWPWVLWGLGASAFHIFLFRQFFASIPKDLESAAEIDGCGRLRTYLTIIVPVSKAAFTASAIFAFQWAWSNYLIPSLFLNDRLMPFSVTLVWGLQPPYRSDLAKDTPVQLAGSFYYMLPMVIIFFFAQKYVVKGVVTTGIKG